MGTRSHVLDNQMEIESRLPMVIEGHSKCIVFYVQMDEDVLIVI